jgi:hypothetical protein
MNAKLPGGFDHPSWLAVVGTFVGYGVILVLMTIALFLIPYLIFMAL